MKKFLKQEKQKNKNENRAKNFEKKNRKVEKIKEKS